MTTRSDKQSILVIRVLVLYYFNSRLNPPLFKAMCYTMLKHVCNGTNESNVVADDDFDLDFHRHRHRRRHRRQDDDVGEDSNDADNTYFKCIFVPLPEKAI